MTRFSSAPSKHKVELKENVCYLFCKKSLRYPFSAIKKYILLSDIISKMIYLHD